MFFTLTPRQLWTVPKKHKKANFTIESICSMIDHTKIKTILPFPIRYSNWSWWWSSCNSLSGMTYGLGCKQKHDSLQNQADHDISLPIKAHRLPWFQHGHSKHTINSSKDWLFCAIFGTVKEWWKETHLKLFYDIWAPTIKVSNDSIANSHPVK